MAYLVGVGAHGEGTTAGLRAAIATDFRAATGWRRVALAGVVVWLAYEWGPGNETVTPWVVARVIDANDGAAVIALSAAVGFGFTAIQQLLAGFTALAGFSMFMRTSRAAVAHLGAQWGATPVRWDELGFWSRCAVSFGLGTTAVAALQIVATGEVGVRPHLAVIRRSALLCAGLVGVLAAVAGTLAWAGRRSERFVGPTERALDVLSNPLLWLGVLAVMVATRRWRRPAAAAA